MTQEKEYFNYFGQSLPKSVKSLYYIYRTEFELKFEIHPPKLTIKNTKLFKDLIEEFGFDITLELIIWILHNWNKISNYLKVLTYPSPSFIYGFRHSLLALKNSNKIKSEITIHNHNDLFDS